MALVDDGGPAFPRTGGTVDGPNVPEWAPPQTGMSLRDYFAGQALAALIATYGTANGEDDHLLPWCAAGDAYDYADAMLKARALTKEPNEPEGRDE